MFFISFIISILTLGAVGDGETDNTRPINEALSQCSLKGGGTVEVPQGVFVTGSLHVPSGVTLHLDSGAVLRGTSDLSKYEPLRTKRDLTKYSTGAGTVNDNSAANPNWSLALIHVTDAQNVRIEGRGIIDGADVRNPKGEESMRGPHTLLFANCSNVSVSGITIMRAANYAVLGYELNRANFRHLTIMGGWDGVHLRGVQRTSIEDCHIESGDDAIAGGYWQQMRISRCFLNSSCNGIRMIQPSQRLTVEDCTIVGPGRHSHITSGKTNSDAAISIEPGGWGISPGLTDKVVIRHLKCRTVLTPLSVTLAEECPMGSLLVDGLQARDVTRMALSVKSWGKVHAKKVTLRHLDMEFRGIDDPSVPAMFKNLSTDRWPYFPSYGLYFRNVDEVRLKDVRCRTIGKDYRPAMLTDNVGKLKMDTTSANQIIKL